MTYKSNERKLGPDRPAIDRDRRYTILPPTQPIPKSKHVEVGQVEGSGNPVADSWAQWLRTSQKHDK